MDKTVAEAIAETINAETRIMGGSLVAEVYATGDGWSVEVSAMTGGVLFYINEGELPDKKDER